MIINPTFVLLFVRLYKMVHFFLFFKVGNGLRASDRRKECKVEIMADRHSMRGTVGDYVLDTKHGEVQAKIEETREKIRYRGRGRPRNYYADGSEVKIEDNRSEYSNYDFEKK